MASCSFLRIFPGWCGRHRRKNFYLLSLFRSYKGEQAIFQRGRGIPFGKQRRELQPTSLVIRDDKLPRQRSLVIFDPYLPVNILLPEGQMMTKYTLNLVQSLVMAGNYLIRKIFIALAVYQVSKGALRLKAWMA